MPLTKRLAWAERNHVTPPAAIAHKSTAIPAVKKFEVARDYSAASTRQVKPRSIEPDGETSPRWIVALQAMKCRGLGTYWSVAVQPTLAADESVVDRLNLAPLDTIAVLDEYSDSWESTPPVPPG